MIGKRYYQEDSTLSEIKAIKERTWKYGDHIIWVNEMPKLSPFSININFDEMDFHSQDWDKYVLIIDLRGSERPDAKTRRAINERFLHISDRLIHCAYITGKNSLTNAAIRFVMYGMEHSSYSVSTDETEALAKVRNQLKLVNHEH